MAAELRARFEQCKASGKTAFVAFVTGGYPTQGATVPILLGLQAGGADVIEVGIPFSDPQADGATIQKANVKALAGGMTVVRCLSLIKEAREQGLTIPVVLMGYFNPILAYGIASLAKDARAAGVTGFIIVDLPGDSAVEVLGSFNAEGLALIPLVTPATTDDRISKLATLASGFIYCVSVTGVTGARASVNNDLPAFIARVRDQVGNIPIAVGFGISKPEHVKEVGAHADGAVVGSAIIAVIEKAEEAGGDAAAIGTAVRDFITELTGGTVLGPPAEPAPKFVAPTGAGFADESAEFRFGKFGGRYIPETLVAAMEDFWAEYLKVRDDPEFIAELAWYRKEYIGGPTPVFHCKRLSEHCGGAQLWMKREDLAHTGAHKINNALGQALLAKRLGKKRVIAETGAGQHGVATATACALLGLEAIIYMGAEDTRRQALNVFRMNVLGAKVIAVQTGSRTLKDAINEAMRDWVTNVHDTHYIVGSAIGPHPFPTVVRDFQAVMGKEARAQMLEKTGRLPDIVTACVGGGSNAIGIMHPFVEDEAVQLVGVEAGGEKGAEKGEGLHSATLSHGKPGVLHGVMTYLLQDDDGQIERTHSLSAGLDYPGVGPEHAMMKDSGRAKYVAVNNDSALEGFKKLSQLEGIIPALETSHAIGWAMEEAARLPKDKIILVNLSGRGDKDMLEVARIMGIEIDVSGGKKD